MKKILIRIVNRVKFNWTVFRLHNSTPGRVLKREARNSDVFGCGSDLLKLIDAKLALVENSFKTWKGYEDQEYVYNQKKGSLGTEKADLIAIHPGYSEHQTGLAIDVSTPGANTTTFDTTDEFKWLENNAHKYGFILRYPKGKQYLTGIAYESWHYRYVGIEAATKIHDEGITFDEYYEFYLR